jgi:hypothetical protein
VNRTLVGWLALVCVAGGAAVLILDSYENPWAASLIRVGVVLAVLWMALPTSTRPAAWSGFSPWLTVAVVVAALFAVRKPMIFFPLLAVIAIAALILRPRRKR